MSIKLSYNLKNKEKFKSHNKWMNGVSVIPAIVPFIKYQHWSSIHQEWMTNHLMLMHIASTYQHLHYNYILLSRSLNRRDLETCRSKCKFGDPYLYMSHLLEHLKARFSKPPSSGRTKLYRPKTGMVRLWKMVRNLGPSKETQTRPVP